MNEKSSSDKFSKPYKNEQFLQIYLPLAIFILLVIGLIVGVVLVSEGNVNSIFHWGNISAVVIIVPLLFDILIFLAITVLVIIGLAKLIKWMPIHLSKVYVFIIRIAIIIMNGSNKLTSPIINTRAKISSLKSISRKGKQ